MPRTIQVLRKPAGPLSSKKGKHPAGPPVSKVSKKVSKKAAPPKANPKDRAPKTKPGTVATGKKPQGRFSTKTPENAPREKPKRKDTKPEKARSSYFSCGAEQEYVKKLLKFDPNEILDNVPEENKFPAIVKKGKDREALCLRVGILRAEGRFMTVLNIILNYYGKQLANSVFARALPKIRRVGNKNKTIKLRGKDVESALRELGYKYLLPETA